MTAVLGAKIAMTKLAKLPAAGRAEILKANIRSGDELVRLAKILIPVGGDVHGDGAERDKITGTPNPADGSYLFDAGPKSKVIEGNRGPRPFVNPALSVTRKKHRNRAKRALKLAVKKSFGV